ncbi:MAG: ATP synthase subunit I [Alphaproteobacteria bacterium]|nr:ATP synthase subunit I [Alphaproteobacteria bacterium]
MTDPKHILRDSAVLLTGMVVVAGVLGGLSWAVGVAAGGLLVLVNAALILRLVQRVVAQVASGVELAVGLLAKTLLSLAALYFMLEWLLIPAVLVGLVTVVSAIGLRSIFRVFAAPPSGPETAREA